jgi:hypothetical protein
MKHLTRLLLGMAVIVFVIAAFFIGIIMSTFLLMDLQLFLLALALLVASYGIGTLIDKKMLKF